MQKLRFIDLFAGLGGFHQALKQLGHQCVFASEIDPELCELYRANFNLRPHGDIRSIPLEEIPKHDILCAGFPCQPFSQAGSQKGFACDRWGDLFDSIVKILQHSKPDYFIIENVLNLERHEGGKTWESIIFDLKSVGYDIDEKNYSPHQFGIPQLRRRKFIVGCRHGIGYFEWPKIDDDQKSTSIESVLEKKPSGAKKLDDKSIEYLDAWQEFISTYPKDKKIPGFPIWAMEFGANYTLQADNRKEFKASIDKDSKGAFGEKLYGKTDSEIKDLLPPYARDFSKPFPKWKQTYINQNRELYDANKEWLDSWLPRIRSFNSSFQKLEWNCKEEERNIWKYIIQLRASGIRVKKKNYAPALVAISQIPIIAWEKRYMTIRECGRLQSMDEIILPSVSSRAARALGNAVNVTVVKKIAEQLLAVEGEGMETRLRSYG